MTLGKMRELMTCLELFNKEFIRDQCVAADYPKVKIQVIKLVDSFIGEEVDTSIPVLTLSLIACLRNAIDESIFHNATKGTTP